MKELFPKVFAEGNSEVFANLALQLEKYIEDNRKDVSDLASQFVDIKYLNDIKTFSKNFKIERAFAENYEAFLLSEKIDNVNHIYSHFLNLIQTANEKFYNLLSEKYKIYNY